MMNYKFIKMYPLRLRTDYLGFMVSLLFLGCLNVQAQFNSGSTGADGAFNPPANQTTVVTLPESGILNYTTVNIPSGATVKFSHNSNNTPVIILATGDVSIAGNISMNGENSRGVSGGQGGPGGFNGGDGGLNLNQQITRGKNGEGPGGGLGGGSDTALGYGGGAGYATLGGKSVTGMTNNPPFINGAGGPAYGLRTLIPLLGGSGGGGGSSSTSSPGTGGGGGGGALLIASSTVITVSGSNPSFDLSGGFIGGSGATFGGCGSGGSLRLIANSITGNLGGSLRGGSVSGGGNGSPGYLRLEAFNLSVSNAESLGGIISRSTPKPVFPNNSPTLRITSVAGQSAPAQPKGSFQEQPDIIVPTTQTNPATVALTASGIPLGSVIRVTLTPENGDRISVQSTPLSGTVAASTATASISLPNGISIIYASATIELPSSGAKAMFINGENVDRIELSATFGGKTEVSYILKSGKKLILDQ